MSKTSKWPGHLGHLGQITRAYPKIVMGGTLGTLGTGGSCLIPGPVKNWDTWDTWDTYCELDQKIMEVGHLGHLGQMPRAW